MKETTNQRAVYNELLKRGFAAGYEIPLELFVFPCQSKLAADIYLPKERCVIEVNGKSHYQPIYGEANYLKVCAQDAEKKELVRNAGLRQIDLILLEKCGHCESIIDLAVNRLVSALKNNEQYQSVDVN